MSVSRQALHFVLRAAVILSMSFAMAFGFLAGSTSSFVDILQRSAGVARDERSG